MCLCASLCADGGVGDEVDLGVLCLDPRVTLIRVLALVRPPAVPRRRVVHLEEYVEAGRDNSWGQERGGRGGGGDELGGEWGVSGGE